MVQPSWEWVLMGVVSTALNQGKWASYNGVALEKQRKNSLIFMHRLTCRRAFVLLRWCFHCFRYKWNSKNLSLLLVTPKRVIAVTQYIEPYMKKEQLPDNTNKTSRGLEKVAAWPKGTRFFNNRLIKSLRFTTPVAIIGEAERIWFQRRRYRTVKIVLLRRNK